MWCETFPTMIHPPMNAQSDRRLDSRQSISKKDVLLLAENMRRRITHWARARSLLLELGRNLRLEKRLRFPYFRAEAPHGAAV